MDCVASLYGRNHLEEFVRETVKDIFVPITVGGDIRSVDDAKKCYEQVQIRLH
jgi:cyclase